MHPANLILPPAEPLLPESCVLVSYDFEAVRGNTNLPLNPADAILSFGAAAFLWPEAIMAFNPCLQVNIRPEVAIDDANREFWSKHRKALWVNHLSPQPREEGMHDVLDWLWELRNLHNRPLALLCRPHKYDGLLLASALHNITYYKHPLPEDTTWHDALTSLAFRHMHVPDDHLHQEFVRLLGELIHHPVDDSIRQFQAFSWLWHATFPTTEPPPHQA